MIINLSVFLNIIQDFLDHLSDVFLTIVLNVIICLMCNSFGHCLFRSRYVRVFGPLQSLETDDFHYICVTDRARELCEVYVFVERWRWVLRRTLAKLTLGLLRKDFEGLYVFFVLYKFLSGFLGLLVCWRIHCREDLYQFHL